MNPQKLTIKHGPTFSGIISTVGMWAMIASFVACIIFYKNDELDNFSYSFLALFISIGVFLDMRGVVIDFANNQIMEYQSIWGVKRGTWESISDFKSIVLTYENTTKSNSIRTTTQGDRSAPGTYSYCLVLRPEKGNDSILPFEIGEYGSHKTGRRMLLKMAKRFNFPHYDVFYEKSKSAQKRRMEHEVEHFFKHQKRRRK